MRNLITLAICLGFACVPATYRAGIRRMAEYQLKNCIDARYPFHRVCYDVTRSYCHTKGLEAQCGEGYQP